MSYVVAYDYISSLHQHTICFVSSVRGGVDGDAVMLVTEDMIVINVMSETEANRLDISNHVNIVIQK